jgi:hypothetical protein
MASRWLLASAQRRVMMESAPCDGPVRAGLLEALADDGLAACPDDAGVDKQAA